MSDAVSDPHAFAAANAAADKAYLESLTPEEAALALERMLEFGARLRKAAPAFHPEPPLPSGWPALLIGRDEESDGNDTRGDGS